jgi:hypothetical protein
LLPHQSVFRLRKEFGEAQAWTVLQTNLFNADSPVTLQILSLLVVKEADVSQNTAAKQHISSQTRHVLLETLA